METLLPKTLVVFDFDGVIVDSADVHRRTYQAIFAAFGKTFPLDTPEKWREGYQSKWELNFLQNGVSQQEIRSMLARYWEYIDYSEVSFFAGIPDILKELGLHHQLAILSSTKSPVITEKLSEQHLTEIFWRIDGRDDVSAKGAKLGALIQDAGVTPDRTVMIGDTESDILAAMSQNSKSIAVTYGWYPQARFSGTTPELFVDRPNLIPAAVKQLLGY